jgi:PPOX class probable F420-dependent enzyme
VATVLDRTARAFLARHRVGRLATADAAGAPHVVPFCYAVVGGNVYFVIDEKPKHPGGRALKRMRNIAENPRVAVVVDDYGEDWTTLAFLLVHGRAVVVTAAHERRQALAALRVRYPQYRAMDLDGLAHPLVRIAPSRVHFWQAANTRRERQAGGAQSALRVASSGRRRSRPQQSRPPRR